jgi:hypothetical protein
MAQPSSGARFEATPAPHIAGIETLAPPSFDCSQSPYTIEPEAITGAAAKVAEGEGTFFLIFGFLALLVLLAIAANLGWIPLLPS